MSPEQLSLPPTPVAPARRPRWGRRFAVVAAVVFCISSVFPAVAAFVRDTESWPQWWGVLDVSIAFVLAILAFALLAFVQEKVDRQAEESSYRVYRILTHGILAVLAVFIVFGDRIVWSNCLTGIAWRAWLLLYTLPAWFSAFGGRPEEPVQQEAVNVPTSSRTNP